MSDKIDVTRRNFLLKSGSACAAVGLSGYLAPAIAKSTILNSAEPSPFNFVVVADTHQFVAVSMDGGRWELDGFKSLIVPEIMKDPEGPHEFMVVTGDIDTFPNVDRTIKAQIGQDYPWYPAIGNHDIVDTCNALSPTYGLPAATPQEISDMHDGTYTRKQYQWVKSLSNRNNFKVGPTFNSALAGYDGTEGPKYTNYSWDYENAHFVVLDQYYSNSYASRHTGKFHSATLDWLESNLAANNKEHIFVFAHDPRAESSALFTILSKYGVTGYFCGHTHKYEYTVISGVPRITGAKANNKREIENGYIRVRVDGGQVKMETYLYPPHSTVVPPEPKMDYHILASGNPTSISKNPITKSTMKSALRLKVSGSKVLLSSVQGGVRHKIEVIDASGVVRVTRVGMGYKNYLISANQLPAGMYVARMETKFGVYSEVFFTRH